MKAVATGKASIRINLSKYMVVNVIKQISIIVLLSMGDSLYCQKKIINKSSEFECYLPSGLKCNVNIKGITVGALEKLFEKKGRVWNAYMPEEGVDISFKAFTMEPLFILPLKNQKLSSDRIEELLKKVNDDNTSFRYYFSEGPYGSALGLKADIESFIEKGILDRQFIIETLGQPDEIKESMYAGEQTQCYKYLKIGVRIYILNEEAVAYEELD